MAQDQPAQPFARRLVAPLPEQNRHVVAPTDDTEEISPSGQIPRQRAVGDLRFPL